MTEGLGNVFLYVCMCVRDRGLGKCITVCVSVTEGLDECISVRVIVRYRGVG